MALYGSSVPHDNGGFVVTVICPNAYSHARLMQALNTIVPEAGDEAIVVPVEPAPPIPEVLADEIPADDDESTLGEPPRKDWTACNLITGECE